MNSRRAGSTRTSSQYASAPSFCSPDSIKDGLSLLLDIKLLHQHNESSSSKRTGNRCPFSGVVRQFCASLILFGVFEFNMSSPGSGKRVVGKKGKQKDAVSSSPPVTRTRAQTRAGRAKMNPNIISPRFATVKETIVSSGPRGISPRGGSVNEISSATTRNRLRAGSHSPKLGSPVTSPTARTAAINVACAGDIPAPPPMILSRLKCNPYACLLYTSPSPRD